MLILRHHLVTLMVSLFPQFVYATQSGFVRVDIKEGSFEKVLSAVLNKKNSDWLFSGLKERALPDIHAGAAPEDCTRDLMEKMGLTQAWETCPGVPGYLFGDAAPENALRPRPLRASLSDTRIENLSIGETKISCSQSICDIHIPLQRLEASFDLSFTSIHTGEVTENPAPVSFSIDSRDKEDPVSLSFQINFAGQQLNHAWINTGGSGTFQIADKAIWEISIHEKPLMHSQSQTGPEAEILLPLIPGLDSASASVLAQAVTTDLFPENFFQTGTEQILNNKIAPLIALKVNELINQNLFYQNHRADVRTLNTGSFINAERNFIGSLALKMLTKNLSTALERSKLSGSFSEVKKEGYFEEFSSGINTFHQSLKNSSHEKDSGYLQELLHSIEEIFELLMDLRAEFHEDNLAGSPENLKYCASLINNIRKLYDSTATLKAAINANSQKEKVRFDLSFLPGTSHRFPYPVSLYGLSGWGDPDFLDRHPGSLHPDAEHDLSVTVSIKAINRLLTDLHSKGIFDFSVYDEGHAAEHARVRSEVSVTWPPQISWDENGNKYCINIPEIYAVTRIAGPLKSWDTVRFDMCFLPEIRNKELFLNPELSGSLRVFSYTRPLIMTANVLKSVTVIQPVVAQILINNLIVASGNEALARGFLMNEISSDGHSLIKFDITGVESDREKISIFVKITENQP